MPLLVALVMGNYSLGGNGITVFQTLDLLFGGRGN